MKVALIHARVSNNAVPPLGLLSIAGVLKEDSIEVIVWDPPVKSQGFLQEIAEFRPDIIGISLMTAEYARAKEIINLLRQKIPNAVYICGGFHVSALPEESLIGLDVDVAVVGEGELPMKELCANITKGHSFQEIKGISYRHEDKIVHNQRQALIEDLDSVPFNGRELLSTSFDWYLIPPGVIRGEFRVQTTTIITGRGCPYRCVFCASNVIFGHRVRRRSVNNVIAEILYLQARYGVKGVWFLDDCFTFDHSWVHLFCAALIERKINLIWSCQSRIDTLDEELAGHMRLAGCVQIEVGVESGSDKVLKTLSKGVYSDEAEKKFAIMKRLGLRTMANFIIGNPQESVDDIMVTYRLAQRLKPDFIEFNICMPYPGSRLYRIAREKGWLPRDRLEFNTEWSEHFTTTGVMHINIDPKCLLELRSSLQNRFLWSNYSTIAKGFLFSPRFLFILIRSICSYLKNNFSTFCALLKKRRFDALIWDIYAYYSNMARYSVHL